ncbi:MAG: hypothetical protein EPN21_10650 [Methylococcaceae bacterium]|nr:MAG: hypothetical protein EPN21_10650 [Methylococcaceae bacterium]
MSLNPLLFYGLLEVLLVLLVLSGFWYWRWRQLRLRLELAWRAFDAIAEFHRRDLAQSGKNTWIIDATGYLDVLENLAAEEPPGSVESWQALWSELARPAIDAEEKTPSTEAGQPDPELQNMDAMLDQQSRQIADLTTYKNHLIPLLRGKFESMQRFNQELLSNVRHLSGGPSEVRGLQDIIARLEENSEHLQAMLSELEKAKMLAEPPLEALARDNHRLREETARNRAQIRGLKEQQPLCEAKIAELTRKIEQCTQRYNQFQRRYEDLQRDYLQLLK